MTIEIKDSFSNRLEKQLDYIAKDSTTQAKKFKSEIIEQIKKIPENPYIYRKSIYFEDDLIRDLIFKGYRITFRVKINSIEIFGLSKYQNSPY